MVLTVFYSWQSDNPSNLNRNFIEDALRRALKQITTEADVISAARGAVTLDKDTAGLPGTPPIVDAIFSKIDQCAVFVPDLTFVAKTDDDRPTPNANVLIEYGWALKSRGHQRMVPVMNDTFGEPSETNLPFNIRHLRWPLRYTLSDGSAPNRSAIREKLAGDLARAIRTVLEIAPVEVVPEPEFEAVSSTYGKAMFFQQRETLATQMGRFSEAGEKFSMPTAGAKIFIRLIPSVPTEPLLLRQAYDMIVEGRLEPFSLAKITGGAQHDSNRYGAVVYRATPTRQYIKHLTQVFANREIWGISCELWTDEYRFRRNDPLLGSAPGSFRYLPAFYENAFIDGLRSYLRFAQQKLQLILPLRLIVGITGIEEFRISAPQGMSFGGLDQYGGRARVPEIICESMVRDWATPAEEFLLPFFQRVWDSFGLERPEIAP